MIIAIASGKGGTGKTSLAVNLASFWAKQEKIVLVDLDVEEPNSGLFINIPIVRKEDRYKMIPVWQDQKCTHCGLCQSVCNFHAILSLDKSVMVLPELCHSCYACVELCPANALQTGKLKIGELSHFEKDNLTLIEGRLEIGQEQAVPLIAQTKEYTAGHYPDQQIILYDCPPGTSCPVIETVKEVDYVILVTEPTPFGLNDLKLAVDVMKKLGRPIGVVINRDGTGNNAVENWCKEQNLLILAKIPWSREIAELYSKGELYYHLDFVKDQLQNVMNFIELEVKTNQ